LVYQLLIYPVTNYAFDTPSYRENADGHLLTRESMPWFWGHYLANENDGQNAYASPLRARDCRRVPPALVITAEFDPLRDEGEAYAARLREAGVPVEVKRYNGMNRGFFSVVHVSGQLDRVVGDAAAVQRAELAGYVIEQRIVTIAPSKRIKFVTGDCRRQSNSDSEVRSTANPFRLAAFGLRRHALYVVE